MAHLTAIEMYSKLISMGYVAPGKVEPSIHMMPTAYVQVPTSLAFATPPIPLSLDTGEAKDAKLGSRSKGNKQGKKRAKRVRRR